MKMYQSSLTTKVLLLMMLLQWSPSLARVNFRCTFGPILSTQDATGRTHRFCATEMSPPFVELGKYIVARDVTGTCYECTCDVNTRLNGLACCEKACVG